MTVMRTGTTTFIAFTVCPSFEDAYNLQVFAKYNVSKSEYLDGYFRPNTTEFYTEATFNLTEILYQIIVTTGLAIALIYL